MEHWQFIDYYDEEEEYEDEDEEEDHEQRISAEQAKLIFGLTDEDLARLSRPRLRAHPDDPSARPLELYLEREVQERCKTKERHREMAEEASVIIAALREAKAARRARQAREAVNTWLRSLGDGKAPAHTKYGASPLPEEVLALVFDRLVADLEPGGVWGPGLVARQLASASLVCWDWYHAASGAFDELADAVDTRLGQAIGTKPQMVVRLLEALGLAGPTPVPARLLRAVALERGLPHAVDGPDGCAGLMQLVGQLTAAEQGRWPKALSRGQGSLAAARRSLVAAGICSMAELGPTAAEASRQAEEARRQRERETRRAAEAARHRRFRVLCASDQARLDAEVERRMEASRRSRPCACGQTYAAACTNECCGGCCRSGRPGLLPCARHGGHGGLVAPV